jgi:preprotein translocase subunit SecY
MLVVIRVGTHIAVPGINAAAIRELIGSGTLLGLMDLFSGGALASFSVLAMSVTPYITSSIIMSLLQMIIPAWEEMAKEGDEGRRKLQQYGRYGTLILAMMQGLGMAYGLRQAVNNPGWPSYLMIAVALTAGTVFLMWLGEQITDKGIGNGISLIIFAGIVSRSPQGLAKMFQYMAAGGWRLITTGADEGGVGILNMLFLTIIGLLVVASVVLIQEGDRRIPVQYAKRVVGRKMYGGQSTHIPMKVNQAGVIPVIFATSLLAFPATIASFFTHPIAKWITSVLDQRSWVFLFLEFVLIIAFAYFYTAITFNPLDVSNNLKKYGGFVPGIRPGRPTAMYLDRVLTRLTLVGALFLAVIAIMPNFVMTITGVPNVYFGGTALLIVVSVALETMKQVESHLLMRHYQGFLR